MNLLEKNSAQNTLLHVAAYAGRVEFVQEFLNEGLDINVRGSRRRTPLHMACQQGHKALAKFLIQSGADVNLTDAQGKTAYDVTTNIALRQDLLTFMYPRGAAVNGSGGSGHVIDKSRMTPQAMKLMQGKTEVGFTLGDNAIRPDGFVSSANNADLQRKYGHSNVYTDEVAMTTAPPTGTTPTKSNKSIGGKQVVGGGGLYVDSFFGGGTNTTSSSYSRPVPVQQHRPATSIGFSTPPSVFSGNSSSGFTGQSSTGFTGQSSTGFTGQSSTGFTGQSSSGFTGQSSSGFTGQSSSGFTGQSSSGFTGQPQTKPQTKPQTTPQTITPQITTTRRTSIPAPTFSSSTTNTSVPAPTFSSTVPSTTTSQAPTFTGVQQQQSQIPAPTFSSQPRRVVQTQIPAPTFGAPTNNTRAPPTTMSNGYQNNNHLTSPQQNRSFGFGAPIHQQNRKTSPLRSPQGSVGFFSN